jgi:uncharacterized membrane protein YoaT (DUF817 family)
MFRMGLYVLSIGAFASVWAVYREQQRRRPMPVMKAAEMLQNAWADNHTRV